MGGAAPGARANTYPTAGDALRAPRVPTDVGVTRETPPQVGQPAPKASRAPLVLAFVAVVLLCAGGGFLVVRSRSTVTPAATRDPVETAQVAPPPPTLLPSTTTPTAALTPLPSGTVLPSSTGLPSASTASPTNVAGTVPGTPSAKPHVTPTNLNGVQPHF